MSATSIITADDHPLILKALSDFLISKEYNLIESVDNGRSAYNAIVKHQPDIAILDIKMPKMTGIEVAQACKKNNLPTKIVLLTFDNDKTLFEQAEQLGVYGYVLKNLAIDEIEKCIESALNGTPFFSEDVLNNLKKHRKPNNASIEKLTPAELKIVRLISKGQTTQKIADKLQVSPTTVNKHRSNIVGKLNLENSPTALIVWANKNKDCF